MILSFLSVLSLFSSEPMPFYTSASSSRIIQNQKIESISQSKPTYNNNTFHWNGHFSAYKFKNTLPDKKKVIQMKQSIRTLFQSLPKEHTQSIKKLNLKKEKHTSRGMANNDTIILHTESIGSSDEFTAVLTHEIGHIVDLGLFSSSRYTQSSFLNGTESLSADDPSLAFYRISWKEAHTKKDSSDTDFVSGYAQTNCFEDFAESYLFYRFHGDEFRLKSQQSIALQQKYQYLKNFVFQGVEFSQKNSLHISTDIPWDATLLPLF